MIRDRTNPLIYHNICKPRYSEGNKNYLVKNLQYICTILYITIVGQHIVFEQQSQLAGSPHHMTGHVTRDQTKLKVDVLGSLLKKHVSKLRSGTFLFQIAILAGVKEFQLCTISQRLKSYIELKIQLYKTFWRFKGKVGF
jgi:hypothetical protein